MSAANASYGEGRRASSSASGGDRKKGFHVVKEPVLQEKRKLQTEVTLDRQAPNGYTFVPVGDPALTDACRERARQEGLVVYIVSDHKSLAREKSLGQREREEERKERISDHIHRVGHHIPNKIVDWALACAKPRARPGQRARDAASALGSTLIDRHFAAQTRRIGQAAGVTESMLSHSQREEALRNAIKELFPRIPDTDRDAVAERAFAEGKKVVGNSDLPLSRKVQLAVLAHIRHMHTDYDVLLKIFGFLGARKSVEVPCLEIIKKWRGEPVGADEDDDDELVEMEKVMREYVVIDDSEDDDEQEAKHGLTLPQTLSRRRRRRRSSSNSSVELIHDSSQLQKRPRIAEAPVIRPTTTPLVQPRPVRGPQPAQISHLDELSRRHDPLQQQSHRSTSMQQSSAPHHSGQMRGPVAHTIRGSPRGYAGCDSPHVVERDVSHRPPALMQAYPPTTTVWESIERPPPTEYYDHGANTVHYYHRPHYPPGPPR